jgi:hypothetical protein
MRPDDEMSVHGGEDDYMLRCAPPDDEWYARNRWCVAIGVIVFSGVGWMLAWLCGRGVWRMICTALDGGGE